MKNIGNKVRSSFSEHKKKIIAILLILTCGVSINYYLKEDKTETTKEKTVEKEENKDNRRKEANKKLEGTGTEGNVDENLAKDKMSLEIIMDDEIRNELGNEKKLKNAMEKFLIEYGLWDSTTTAEAKWGILKDFNTNINTVDFQLNDINKSTMTVKYYTELDKYDINYN